MPKILHPDLPTGETIHHWNVEEFVQYALESSPKTQLILATHSPEIFAGYENKVIQVKGI